MKKLVSLVILFLFTLVFIYPVPKIELDPIEYQFKTLKSGIIIEDTFTLKNSGDQPLKIRLQTSCGCVVPGEKKITLEPGEEKVLDFTFNTKGYKGEVTKWIAIYSNDPDRPRFSFIIKGNVNPGFGDKINRWYRLGRYFFYRYRIRLIVSVAVLLLLVLLAFTYQIIKKKKGSPSTPSHNSR